MEDFSLYRSTEEAKNIFSAISVFYHPALLDRFQKLPEWEPAGSPSPTVPHTIVLVPPCCDAEVPGDWILQQEEAGIILIRNCQDRESMLTAIFEKLEIENSPFDKEYCDSFLALGLAWFISDLLTRKLRYMSDIDMTELEKFALASINAYKNGDKEAAGDELQKAFDLVCEANEYYFPTPVKFLDYTRFTDDDKSRTSLKEMLLRRKDRREHTNLLLDLPQLETIRLEDPDLLSLLKNEAQAGRIDFLCGDENEAPLYLMPQYEVLKRLTETRKKYRNTVGKAPNVFSRNTAGMSPVLPQLLVLAGWKSGALFTTDGWHLDFQMQSRIQWKSADGTILPALGQEPLDGEKDEIFMEQLDKLGYSYSNDEVMTAVFAHRPNRECAWFGEVERFNRFDPIFGKIMGADEYFENTKDSGSEKILKTDDFRTNFLTRNEQDDPVSRWRTFHRDFISASAELFDELIGQNKNNTPKPNVSAKKNTSAKDKKEKQKNVSFLLKNPSLTKGSVILDGSPEISDGVGADCVRTFIDEKTGIEKSIVTLPPVSCLWVKMKTPSKSAEKTAQSTPKTGLFKRLFAPLLDTNSDDSHNTDTMAGFREDRISRLESHQCYFLRNDFFEIQIDPATGQLRRLQSFENGSLEVRNGLLRQPGRGNRFASHLAYRLAPDELDLDPRSRKDGNYGYSIMAADKIEILENGPAQSRLAVYGSLKLPNGKVAAQFEQIYTVRRASKIVRVKAVIKPKIIPTGPVWKNYYACRFAWKDKFANIRIGSQERFSETSRDYYQAPYGVDIRSGDNLGITVLSNGHPFYHRHANQIDAVLIPAKEHETVFEFGIGVDLDQPAMDAFNFLGPDPIVEPNGVEPKKHFQQLIKIDAQTVIPVAFTEITNEDNERSNTLPANNIEPDIISSEDKITPTPEKKDRGARQILLILQETGGKKNKVVVTPGFSFVKAEILSCLDPDEVPSVTDVLEISKNGSVSLEIAPYKLVPIRFTLR